MPEFCVIFARKTNKKIPQFYLIFTRKYVRNGRKLQENCRKNISFLGGGGEGGAWGNTCPSCLPPQPPPLVSPI